MNRKQYLDIAKGIGIILVVLAHCPQVYNPLKQVIYAFHMPLFFFISGMVWDRNTHEKRGYFNKTFVIDKIKRLIVPCYIWGIIYMLLNAVINKSFHISYFAYLIYGNQAGFSRANSLTSLWFLPCMFLAVCAFEIIQMKIGRSEKKIVLFVISIVSAAVGLLLPHISKGYPWSVDVAFLGLAFMIWGYLGKKLMEKEMPMLLLIGVMVVAAFIITFTYRLNLPYISINNADMAGRYFGNLFLYILDALAGTLTIFFLSRILERIRIVAKGLTYLGKRTIPIFIVHKPIVQLLNRLGLHFELQAVLIVVVSFVISITISLLVYALIIRILPFMFGETKPNR